MPNIKSAADIKRDIATICQPHGYVPAEGGNISGLADMSPTGVMRQAMLTLTTGDMKYIAAYAAPDDPMPLKGAGVWHPERILKGEEAGIEDVTIRLYPLRATVLGINLSPRQLETITKDLIVSVDTLGNDPIDAIRPWNIAAYEAMDGSNHFELAGWELPVYRRHRDIYMNIPLEYAANRTGGMDAYMFLYDTCFLYPESWATGSPPEGSQITPRMQNIRSFALTVMSMPNLRTWSLVRGLTATISMQMFIHAATFDDQLNMMVQRLLENNVSKIPNWDWMALIGTDASAQEAEWERISSELRPKNIAVNGQNNFDPFAVSQEVHAANSQHNPFDEAANTGGVSNIVAWDNISSNIDYQQGSENQPLSESVLSDLASLSMSLKEDDTDEEIENHKLAITTMADTMILEIEPGVREPELRENSFRHHFNALGIVDQLDYTLNSALEAAGQDLKKRATLSSYFFAYRWNSAGIFFYRSILHDGTKAQSDFNFLKQLVDSSPLGWDDELLKCLLNRFASLSERNALLIGTLQSLINSCSQEILTWILKRQWKSDPMNDLARLLSEDSQGTQTALTNILSYNLAMDYSSVTFADACVSFKLQDAASAEADLMDKGAKEIYVRPPNKWARYNYDADPDFPDDPDAELRRRVPEPWNQYPTTNIPFKPYWKSGKIPVLKHAYGAKTWGILVTCGCIAGGAFAIPLILMKYGFMLGICGACLALACSSMFFIMTRVV